MTQSAAKNALEAVEEKEWQIFLRKELDKGFNKSITFEENIFEKDYRISTEEIASTVLDYCSENDYLLERVGPLWLKEQVVIQFRAHKEGEVFKILIMNLLDDYKTPLGVKVIREEE